MERSIGPLAQTEAPLEIFRFQAQAGVDSRLVTKLSFPCHADGTMQPPAALETLAAGWFALSELPPLSLGRVNQRQLVRALAHHRDPTLPTEFD